MIAPAVQWLDERIAEVAAEMAARHTSLSSAGSWASATVSGLLQREQVAPPPAFDAARFPPHLAEQAAHLRLDPIETLTLLAVALPDLDARYATLYALLHDDAGAMFLTTDLAGRLIGAGAARLLAPDGRLRRERLVAAQAGAPSSCRDRVGLRVHRHLATALRDEVFTEPEVKVLARIDADPCARHQDLLPLLANPGDRPLVLLAGPDAGGHFGLAQSLCAALGRGLVVAPVPPASPQQAEALDDLALLARLNRAGLLLTGGAAPTPLVAHLARGHGPVFLSVTDEAGWEAALLPAGPFVTLHDAMPSAAGRRRLWLDALASAGLVPLPGAVDRVAARHQLDAGAIARVAARLRFGAIRAEDAQVSAPMLLAAAGALRRADFGPLASRLDNQTHWEALVLPETTSETLRDFATAMAESSRIFEDWGFSGVGRGRKSGVTALFTGPSGTGKTMAAGIVAQSAGYETWRIDLSGLVSKYIGETEKNLERVFRAALAADVALFFDEADAIFGARSEVKDSHDRYANLEIAYLLQRLEDHEGPVILASNIAANIDQAFLRRLDFVIEFPMPDAGARMEIWRRSLPAAAPVAEDVDIAFLARQFAFAGGDIRSTALDAAFRAARSGGAIDMGMLLRAVQRQMAKHGRVPALSEFGRYRALMEQAPLRREAAE